MVNFSKAYFFPILGETIGEENPDIRGDMQESCRESRSISSALEKLCESISHSVMGNKSSSSPKGLPLLGMCFPLLFLNLQKKEVLISNFLF